MNRILMATILAVALPAGSLVGQSFKQITSTSAQFHAYGVAMSADGGTLAWLVYEPNSSSPDAEIWTYNAATRTPKLLAKNVSRMWGGMLAMSGDGSTLVVGSNRQLYVVPVKGGTLKRLTTLSTRIAEPGLGMTLSDDGRMVCCTTRPLNSWVSDVEVIDTVTGQRTNITRGGVSEACWGCISGDGKTVAFSARRRSAASPGQVWLADRSGSNIRQLTTFTSGSTGRVRLDRHGRVAAFEHYTGSYNISGCVYSLFTASKRVVNLSGNSSITDLEPVISADGERVTWRSHRKVNGVPVYDIFMAYPEGSVPRRITTFTDQDPTQSYRVDHAVNHDGSMIAFTSRHDPAGKRQADTEVWLFLDGIRQSGRAVPGSVVAYRLEDPAAAGHPYLARCALSRGPVIRLPDGTEIPLAPDALFRLSGAIPSVFRNFAGTLGPSGVGSVSVAIPRVPALVGIPFYTSFVTYRTKIKAHSVVRTEIQSGA